MFAILEQMGAAHPAEPHWYLPLIGVDPQAQRQGLGSTLLAEMLPGFDRAQTTAYLEATSPESLPFINGMASR